MADYGRWAYDPNPEILRRQKLEKLKRNAQGYDLSSHNTLYCIRCGLVVGNTKIHDDYCEPNQIQRDAQLELLIIEGKSGSQVF